MVLHTQETCRDGYAENQFVYVRVRRYVCMHAGHVCKACYEFVYRLLAYT